MIFFCCLDTTRRRGRQFHAFGMACHSFQRHQIFASPCVVCHFVFWSGSLLGAVPCFFLSLSRVGCSAVEGTASYTRKGNHFPAQWNAGVLVMIHKPVDCKDKAANATLLAAGARTWCWAPSWSWAELFCSQGPCYCQASLCDWACHCALWKTAPRFKGHFWDRSCEE